MSNIGNKETMAKNLSYYVGKSGKSQKAISEELGFSRTIFNEWLKGKKYPRIDKIEMMANYFGIAKSDLIEEKNPGLIPENADFHARILKDEEVLKMLEEYYALNKRERQIIRGLVHNLNEKH